jgi:hypothetical protein
MLMVNCDAAVNGMEIDPDFIVDFGKELNGPSRCHETPEQPVYPSLTSVDRPVDMV